jgi:hypothetical protein
LQYVGRAVAGVDDGFHSLQSYQGELGVVSAGPEYRGLGDYALRCRYARKALQAVAAERTAYGGCRADFFGRGVGSDRILCAT